MELKLTGPTTESITLKRMLRNLGIILNIIRNTIILSIITAVKRIRLQKLNQLPPLKSKLTKRKTKKNIIMPKSIITINLRNRRKNQRRKRRFS